jgi:hypothetical protein
MVDVWRQYLENKNTDIYYVRMETVLWGIVVGKKKRSKIFFSKFILVGVFGNFYLNIQSSY